MPRKVHDSYPKLNKNTRIPNQLPQNAIEKLEYLESRIYFEHANVTKNSQLENNDKRRWADDLHPDYNSLYNRISFYNGNDQYLYSLKKDVLQFSNPSPQCEKYYNILKEKNGLYKYPMNPVQCTGYTGRGLLGKWGPNYAADPIVVTKIPGTMFGLKFVAIKRSDCGLWAIPGGMVEYGDTVSHTLRKEFTEETQNLPNIDKNQIETLLNKVFNNGKLIYRGYIDDPRNTDNAWIETSVYYFLIENYIANKLMLRAGDDACNVDWVNISNKDIRYVNLYADHKQYIDKVYYKNVFLTLIDYIIFYIYIVIVLIVCNFIAHLYSHY